MLQGARAVGGRHVGIFWTLTGLLIFLWCARTPHLVGVNSHTMATLAMLLLLDWCIVDAAMSMVQRMSGACNGSRSLWDTDCAVWS